MGERLHKAIKDLKNDKRMTAEFYDRFNAEIDRVNWAVCNKEGKVGAGAKRAAWKLRGMFELAAPPAILSMHLTGDAIDWCVHWAISRSSVGAGLCSFPQ